MIDAIIPARGGSIGIPRKNIVLAGDHPLIAYSIIACKLSKNINRIFVSTDDKETAKIARSYGALIPFMRPPEISHDKSPDVEFLKHFFDNVQIEDVALIRPTSPLRNPSIIDDGINTYFKMKGVISSLRSLNRASENPYKMFHIVNNICCGIFESFQGIKNYSNLPRQTFPEYYVGNGYIDVVNRHTVQQGDSFGDKIYAFVVDKITDIDTYRDLEILRTEINTEKDLLTKYLGKI